MSSLTNGLDHTFSNTILMIDTNTTKGQLLLMGITMTMKLLGDKDHIVSVKVLDSDTNIGGPPLKQ